MRWLFKKNVVPGERFVPTIIYNGDLSMLKLFHEHHVRMPDDFYITLAIKDHQAIYKWAKSVNIPESRIDTLEGLMHREDLVADWVKKIYF